MAYFVSRRKLKKRNHSTTMNNINITPMVDVMLVLLVIFMVTAPMMKSGVHVNLPQAQAKPLKSSRNPISIIVKQNGRIYIGNVRVYYKTMLKYLDKLSKKQFHNQLYIKGDRDVTYGEVARIMVIIAKHGYTKIALVTIPKDK